LAQLGSPARGERREALIVVSSDAGWSALTRDLQELGIPPTHAFPPRCVIAELDPAALDRIRRGPGVRVVLDAIPESELGVLPEELRLVAAAWNERFRSKGHAEGRGRGLSWDAPGFLPPDPPATVREYLRQREAELAREESPEPRPDDSDETEKP